jgi:hypothetical protein
MSAKFWLADDELERWAVQIEIVERTASTPGAWCVRTARSQNNETVMLHPIPRDQWPLWASGVARWQEPGDAGVGDTIHRKLGLLGEIFKGTLKAMGVPCGCDGRRADWNVMYPYDLTRDY